MASPTGLSKFHGLSNRALQPASPNNLLVHRVIQVKEDVTLEHTGERRYRWGWLDARGEPDDNGERRAVVQCGLLARRARGR